MTSANVVEDASIPMPTTFPSEQIWRSIPCVKPNIEYLRLVMSRVRIEMKQFVERVNNGGALRKAAGQRIARV